VPVLVRQILEHTANTCLIIISGYGATYRPTCQPQGPNLVRAVSELLRRKHGTLYRYISVHHQPRSVPDWTQIPPVQVRLHMTLPPRTIEEWTNLLLTPLLFFMEVVTLDTLWRAITFAKKVVNLSRLSVRLSIRLSVDKQDGSKRFSWISRNFWDWEGYARDKK